MENIGFKEVIEEKEDNIIKIRKEILIGGDMRIKVVEVMSKIEKRIGRESKKWGKWLIEECEEIEKIEIVDIEKLMIDIEGKRRNGEGRDKENIGMVEKDWKKEEDLMKWIVEEGSKEGEVRKVGEEIIGRVDEKEVERIDIIVIEDGGGEGRINRKKMKRNMRRIGEEIEIGIEEREGEIKKIIDIERIGGVLKSKENLLGNGNEEIIENLKN